MSCSPHPESSPQQRVLSAERELDTFQASIEDQVSSAERAAEVAEASRQAAEEACTGTPRNPSPSPIPLPIPET